MSASGVNVVIISVVGKLEQKKMRPVIPSITLFYCMYLFYDVEIMFKIQKQCFRLMNMGPIENMPSTKLFHFFILQWHLKI